MTDVGSSSEKVYIGLDSEPVRVKPGCERRVVVITLRREDDLPDVAFILRFGLVLF